MAKRPFTVELDDETIGYLSTLGEPVEVLARLANAAGDGVRRRRPQREQTDVSLRAERSRVDDREGGQRDALEAAAAEVVRIARDRADHVVDAAQDDADRAGMPHSAISAARARDVLEVERSDADALLEVERTQRRRAQAEWLVVVRDATDKDLTGERVGADELIVDLREANQQMVGATIRAHDLAVEADEAKLRAEAGEAELRAVAEFREMFIGMLGHDLRTPLGSIVMAAGLLLQRGNLDEPDALATARIIRSAQRITRMITQLLDLTRARLGGGLPIEAEPTDLGDVCQTVIDEFDTSIALDAEGDLTGTWDADRLAEVLSNVVGNALEYATRGTPVAVKARGGAQEVVVEVSNQGVPIPGDLLPFIFEPFRRAPGHAKSRTGSLGLGLYIAHQIARAHGGTLVAGSSDGVTTFVLRLPRQRPAAPPG